MANLIIQENGEVRTRSAIHGEELTIQTPCDCSTVTGVQIADDVFPFCDACGNTLAGVGNLFAKDSLIRVLIDTVNNRAIIMNRGITAENIGAAPISHMDDITNPHQVTPEQIGAVTNTNFTSHKNNKNNPHGVTAEQVGARPSNWIPTVDEVGAAPATHKHSASDITSGTLGVNRGGTGATSIASAREKLEVAHAVESSEYAGCYYRTVNGVQEWINPPEVLDTEYKTTERWNGKAVYSKVVNCGKLPDTSEKTIAHGITGVTTFLTVRAMASLAGDTQFEMVKCEGDSVKANSTIVTIKTMWNATSFQGYTFLKYVKE